MSILINAKDRRKWRKKQLRINASIKNRLFGHLFMAPCCYCKFVFLVKNLTIEHLVPHTLGGGNDDDNIALACAPCNKQKGQEAWSLKKIIRKRYINEQYSS